MVKRVCIVIDSELDKQIRNMQATLIKKHSKSFSYSKVLGMVLKKGLKK